MHNFIAFSSCFFDFFFWLIWLESIFVFLHCFCYIKWLSKNCFFFIFDLWNSFFHQVFCELQKINCILLNFNQKVQMFWNSKCVTDFLDYFNICFLSWFVFNHFFHSDIEVKECFYWFMIWNLVKFNCYLIIYQSIMNY